MMNIRSLFLENMGIRQTIAKNTFWLVLSEIVSRVAGLFLVIHIARTLGANEYGKFTFAFSFAFVVSIFSNMGISEIATREFSRNKENEKNLSDILGLQVILSLFILIAALIGSFFITSDIETRQALWILTFFVLSNGFLGVLFSFLRARQKMEHEAGIKFFQTFLSLAVVMTVILFIPSITNLSYGYLLSNIAVLIIALAYFNFHFQGLKIRFKKESFNILRISWPLSFGLMLGWIYISINSVILGYFGLISENGWYNAASRIAIVAIVPASLIVRSFYPALSSFFVSSKQHFQRTWNYLMESMILLAIPTVMGGLAQADRIIHAFYGREFAPSVFALQLFIVVAGISFINYPYSAILVVSDHQKSFFFIMAAGAFLNIALTFLLLPVFGFYGAIISIIIASTLIFLATVFLTRRLSLVIPFDWNLAKVSLVSLFSSAAMLFLISYKFIYELNIMIVLLVGAGVYSLLLLTCYRFVFPNRILILTEWKNGLKKL